MLFSFFLSIDCSYCDTPGIDQAAFNLTEKDLLADIHLQLTGYPFLKLLITGGEPLACNRQEALFALIKKYNGKTDIYRETNGSVKIQSFPGNVHFVCDWKTPSSGCENSFEPENLSILRPAQDCLKFVCNSQDFDCVQKKIREAAMVNPGLPLYLSPQWGALSYKDLAEFILTKKLPASMSVQLHKIIWDKGKEGMSNDMSTNVP
jgi:organic radical activating enzyme